MPPQSSNRISTCTAGWQWAGWEIAGWAAWCPAGLCRPARGQTRRARSCSRSPRPGILHSQAVSRPISPSLWQLPSTRRAPPSASAGVSPETARWPRPSTASHSSGRSTPSVSPCPRSCRGHRGRAAPGCSPCCSIWLPGSASAGRCSCSHAPAQPPCCSVAGL